jgi:hypothetical protein
MEMKNQILTASPKELNAKNQKGSRPFKYTTRQLKIIVRSKKFLMNNKRYFLGAGIILAYCLDNNMTMPSSMASSIGGAGLLYSAYYLKGILDMNFKFERDIDSEEAMR